MKLEIDIPDHRFQLNDIVRLILPVKEQFALIVGKIHDVTTNAVMSYVQGCGLTCGILSHRYYIVVQEKSISVVGWTIMPGTVLSLEVGQVDALAEKMGYNGHVYSQNELAANREWVSEYVGRVVPGMDLASWLSDKKSTSAAEGMVAVCEATESTS
jgi:hypothetical protein